MVTTYNVSAFCPQTKVQYRRWLFCQATIPSMKIWSWRSWKCLRSAVCLSPFLFPALSFIPFLSQIQRQGGGGCPWTRHKGHGQTDKDRVAFRRWMFYSVMQCRVMGNMLIHCKSGCWPGSTFAHAVLSQLKSLKMWSTCDLSERPWLLWSSMASGT